MIGCGTSSFTDPDDYRARVPGARINLVLTSGTDFKARLTWVNLQRLSLARMDENLPRIAFVALVRGPVFISFLTRNQPPALWNGVKIHWGEFMLHSRGERIYQRTGGASRWGTMSLAPKDLEQYSWALARVRLKPPQSATILRPPPCLARTLLRLHAQACRVVEARPETVIHKEVARALEQDLLHALINCLISQGMECDGHTRLRHVTIMGRFEDVLASRSHEQLPLPELCAAIGVQERTLRSYCGEFLGISPAHYNRLRRLNLVRAALLRANPKIDTVAELARRYGFTELGRFAAAYRNVFRENPSTTLQRLPSNIREMDNAAEFA
jgi:AraC-like DNA-binding protein